MRGGERCTEGNEATAKGEDLEEVFSVFILASRRAGVLAGCFSGVDIDKVNDALV